MKELAKHFLQSYYKIKRLEINNGDFRYKDYSLSEEFSTAANPLFIVADSVNKERKRVQFSFKTGLKPYGDARINLSINPKDSGDFDLHYHIQKLPAALFNPYLITYTSFPLDRGTLEFKGTWNVRNSVIKSENHIVVIDPRIAKRIKKKDVKWMPLPLIMAFVRERGNVIDYEIPITGDLKNPKFHLKDVLLDLLANIFIKPPTTPYGIKVKEVENEVEKSLTIKWEMRQSALDDHQEKFMQKLSDFLKENKNAAITVFPFLYSQKEEEYILFFEACKKYFLITNNKKNSDFTREDSMKVSKMSIKDSSFIHYLNNSVGKEMVFTVQEKCSRFVGDEIVIRRYRELVKRREDAFMSYFNKNGTSDRVKMHSSKNGIPYNGFSYFKIDYKEEIPESLRKAYEELNEMDDEYPRKKYFWQRKETREIIIGAVDKNKK